MKIERKDKRSMLMSLERIAFWQFAAFVLLMCLIWLNEITDLASIFFGTEPGESNIFRAYSLTIVTIVCAIITVGHTYMQEKLIIKDMVKICSNCRKIQIDEAVWSAIDKYLDRHSLVEFSHGLCPDCAAKMADTVNPEKG